MAMADGVKLFNESNNAVVEEEKILPVSYDYQLTEASVLEDSFMLDNEPQNLSTADNASACEGEGHAKELNEVSSFCYDRTTNVKRTRGRPRKDCQRPTKHHLGQSMATKVFPGRPRFRGRKHLQHYFMTHSTPKLQDAPSTLDVYDDIDSDLKSSSEISGKMLISSDAVPDNEVRIEKYCALCNLSEKSLLGQGKLKQYKPSEGFHCFEEMEERFKEKSLQVTSSEGGSELKLFFKKQKIMNRSGDCVRLNRSKSFPEKSSLLNDLIQELELTGFKAMPDSHELFEQTGELYVHFNCAAWSDGVTKTFENLLSNVDKAVVAAAFQKCSKCYRYGASVRCCVSECSKIYHYPCAIVSGALQNANCFKIICSIHLEDAFSFGVICMACHESGDLSQLLLCTSCSNYYHGTCMDPPIIPSSDLRAGWQCLDCKVCQNCRQPVESGKMIICNTCDKAYHTFCVKPAISSVPKSGWKCSACRMCGDCGARTPGNGPSSRWHMNYSVCDSCYQQRNKGIACPLCGKAYRQFSQRKGMKHCTICQKYIHEECDKRSRRNSIDYICPLCSSVDVKCIEGGDLHIKDNFLTSSRDSFLSGNEESFSSDSEEANDGVHCKIASRRPCSSDLRHKKSFKPKYKSFSIPNFLYSVKEYKMDDDDPTEDNKLILASATDEFVLCQDLCVMCGSFGRGEEGRLIACAQCGQCYHSYCVSVKVTTVVLKKGWRCLDCTVCEGCGQPHDEGRLLLCDECDISFHIYCLDPPLQEVPQGNWKCKWCVNCLKCGSKSPGLNCSWQMNYTLCGPCASYSSCCICQQHYEENELVIQCSKCERWLHTMCDQIEDEDQAEKCAEYGYNCPHCRPPDELPPHLLPLPRTPTPEIEVLPEKQVSPVRPKEVAEPPVVKSKHPIQFFLDGVCLSESGMQYIKSLAPDQPKKIPRPRKIKQNLTGFSLQTIDRNEDSTSAIAPEEIKSEPMSVEELALKAYDFEEGRLVIDSSAIDDKKKRPRKLQKLGIGGFSVKPRGRCTTGKDFVGETDANAFQSYEGLPAAHSETNAQLGDASEPNGGDKPKRKRKPKKKTHLDESFPTYLRDAFFGRDLLMSCKKLGKSADVHEDSVKVASDNGLKGSMESGLPLKEEKDFPAVVGSVKNRDINVTYKSMIKSEIESIKEEHLSSTSSSTSHDTPVFSTGSSTTPKVSNLYTMSSSSVPGTHSTLHHSVVQNFHHPDSNSSWPDTDCDQTQMQKSLLKWESDEQLGLLSTISPVLYANINLPHLKIEFPAWADRVKQIAKIWRGLPPEKRQPYLQRARENRAASRTQRSSSTESDKAQRESRVESEQEKQWKQLQAMRQMQHHTQQRLYQEQRQQTVLKTQADKPNLSGVEMDKNLKLYHSKSLSEIPQFTNVEGKENRKVFEKRWSSSAIDINMAQNMMQNTQIKREPETPVQPSFQNTSISTQKNIIHASRVPTSLDSQFSVPDTIVSVANPMKKMDSFHVSSPLPQTVSQLHKTQLPISASSVLMNQNEITKGTASTDPKEILNTPPTLPRPHSSDSFFQISASPQSQLLASLDSRSQPSPSSSKVASSVIESPKSSESIKVPHHSPPLNSPSHQQLQPSVEQFVLQSSLSSANLVKQLSQYKETFGSINNASRTLDKPVEQQNLEQFLQEGQLALTYPNKTAQLKDLLQNKKFCDSEMDGNKEGQLEKQTSLSSSEVCPVTASSCIENTVDSAKNSFSSNLVSQKSPKEQVTVEQESQPAADDFLDAESEKKSSILDNVCLPLETKDQSKEEEEVEEEEEEERADLSKKRKTTAADLVKDLETQPEDHDVIASGCSLDVLPGDVGELELDDDELLGLGNDFNILEYADPELDKSLVGEGDKNNILDEHLDLDDKDEELEDDVIKESDVTQEKDLISQELSEEKREVEAENEKCKDADDLQKDSELSDNFLNYDKKDVQTSVSFDNKSLESSVNNPPVEHLSSAIKEEAKPIFSSCSLSSQTYSPNVDVKLEKTSSENCSAQKSHSLPFGPENQTLNPPPLQCHEPPSYRMVTALKQAVVTHQHQPPTSLVHHNKGLFPLHINMNMRDDLPQQSIISSTADEAGKPLLLQEQPLLLAELVEQEKREQRRHTQEGMISPHGDALLSDIDFERLKDDVFSGPPDDSLGVPGSLLGSHDPSMNISSSANFGPPPYSLLWQNQDTARPVSAGFIPNLKKSSVSAVISSLGLQSTSLTQKTQIVSGNVNSRSLHPNFVTSPPIDPHIDPEKLKLMSYEKQLLHQQAVLSTQQKYFETEVIRLRKIKKALNAKQRQLRKNGSELTENDSVELARVSQEQAGLQKQLDQVRKQTRQNTVALQDYRLKQQKRQQQQQPQPVPIHPSVNSSPQNSQSALQFTHTSPTSPSVRLPNSPSPQIQHQGMFSTLQLQMVKTENKNWSQGDHSIPESMPKKEPLDRNLPQQSFPLNSPLHSSQNEVALKGLVEVKKRLSEDIFKPTSNESNSSLLATEKEEQDDLKTSSENVSSQNHLMKEQKEDPVSSVKSPVPQSILSQSLPSSVSNTLKFTLRQTGMPTVCLPTDSTAENASEISYREEADPKAEIVKKESEEDLVIKEEILDEQPTVEVKNEKSHEVQIKQEVIEEEVQESSLQQKHKEGENEGSSDEELVNLHKPSSEVEQGEQNVLLKQLLQNCPSADTPRKPDSFIGLRKEDSDDLDKMELPFDVNDLESKSKLIKKPSYLDIRRAQLDKEPTPPPGEKAKLLKRKRVKKKKLEQSGKPEGVLPKKKCRRTSSKIEEGYETYVETLMNKLTSLPPLRILEPNIKPNFSAIPVFGAGDLNVKESQLKGCYGNSSIPNENDIYSFHPFTKEHPQVSTLLPPSSPPYRGFYNQEFPAIAKAFEKNDMPATLKTSTESEHLKTLKDAGSPDTVLSSSSPECCLFETQSKWPKLVFVDKILPESKRNTSPVVPLMYPIPIRLFPKEWNELDDDRDKENIPDDKMEMGLLKNKMSGIGGYSAPLKDSGNVAVTLTLSSAAAEDICGVLSALAELLKIPIPASFEIVERTATPPSQKLGLYRRSKNSDVSIHSLLNGKPRFCRHCDIVVLSAGIRKKAVDLSMSKEEQEEEEVIFCSTNCYMQFALTHQATAILEEKEVGAVVDHIGENAYDKSSIYSATEDSLGVSVLDCKDPIQMMDESLKSEEMEVSNLEMAADNILDSFGMSSANPYDIDLLSDKMEICSQDVPLRKWKSIKYRYWHSDLESARAKRKDDASEKSARPFYHTIKPSQMPKDERKCIFCHMTGDGDTNGAARLLNTDVNKWVHLNCALWSYEVYETVNGALMNVEVAFKRSRHLNCYNCHKPGASVRCFKTRCPNVYHFPCARKEQCAFYKDKTVLCPQHIHKGNPENRLESVAVFRRVYINREEHKQVASMIQDEKYVMRVGSLLFLNIGQLLPQQIQAFHTPNCIYPVGYKVIRMYWSMRKLGRRSQYICTINEVCGKPEFMIQVKDSDQKDVVLKDKTAKGVWQKVLYPIEKMRKQAKTIKIFPDFITGDDLFGLTEPAVLRIIESLPGVDTLCDYNFRYGRSPFLELPLAINPTGCARSEPKLRTHFKRPHTLHTSNTSRSFHSAFAGIYPEVSSSPYIKQFVHSKSSQYRKMKTEWRNNVYLARSRIQGLGLYAARDMEKHTMVIEYIGQLIRNELAERNEAIYDAQNRGVYMFRLDENRVIDATLCGGLARYINHSCNPNCVAEVVQIDRENKILIITNRRVTRGEELSYDYKFEVEDDQHKIPCLCGAPNCRKWMN